MKKHIKKPAIPRYPNAADRKYYIDKFLNALLAVLTVAGAFVTLTFLLFL